MEYVAIGEPNPVGPREGAWCEICKNRGHRPKNCHLLYKYQSTPRSLYCNFCRLVGHEKSNFRAWQLMSERTSDIYRVQGKESSEGVAS